jgi:hypothetical protein
LTDVATTITESARHFIAPEDRPDIQLPDGETLRARVNYARDLGMSERALRRLNLPTTYLANVAYIATKAAGKRLAAGVKCRNEPPARRRRVK